MWKRGVYFLTQVKVTYFRSSGAPLPHHEYDGGVRDYIYKKIYISLEGPRGSATHRRAVTMRRQNHLKKGRYLNVESAGFSKQNQKGRKAESSDRIITKFTNSEFFPAIYNKSGSSWTVWIFRRFSRTPRTKPGVRSR